MMKVFHLLVFCSCLNSLSAQIVQEKYEQQIVSLENQTHRVNVKVNYADRTLKVKVATDSLIIPEFQSINQIKKLSKNFLLIHFQERGGSETQLFRTIILNISRSKINRVFDAYSYTSSHPIYRYDFEVRVLKIEKVKSTFVLKLLQRADSSKRTSGTQHSFSILSLKYDAQQNAFFNKVLYLTGDYLVRGTNGDFAVSYKNERCLGVVLMLDRYYVLNNKWFLEEPGRKLLQL